MVMADSIKEIKIIEGRYSRIRQPYFSQDMVPIEDHMVQVVPELGVGCCLKESSDEAG